MFSPNKKMAGETGITNHRANEKIITFQTSSLGKVIPNYLKKFYSAFTDKPLP